MKALFKNLLPYLAFIALMAVLTVPTAIRAEKSQDKKQPENKDKEHSDVKSDSKETKESKKESKESKEKSEILKKIDKLTAEQLTEIVILAYGGRAELQQVRTNGSEDGIIRLASEDKDIEGRFNRKFMRKEGGGQDLTRVDVELPTQKLTFGFNGYTVWGARDGLNFTPSPEAEASFLASLIHNYDALLRYKEQDSKLERAGSENIVGIDTVLLDLTHRDGTKTRYYISTKTYRILHIQDELKLTPNTEPTKFHESFYDFRPVQNTLVPGKSMLYENGRFIQEIRLTQIKYHTKLDEELFLKY